MKSVLHLEGTYFHFRTFKNTWESTVGPSCRNLMKDWCLREISSSISPSANISLQIGYSAKIHKFCGCAMEFPGVFPTTQIDTHRITGSWGPHSRHPGSVQGTEGNLPDVQDLSFSPLDEAGGGKQKRFQCLWPKLMNCENRLTFLKNPEGRETLLSIPKWRSIVGPLGEHYKREGLRGQKPMSGISELWSLNAGFELMQVVHTVFEVEIPLHSFPHLL